jgi:RNA polymerase sigma-70 factor (ECF subfamily)
MDHLTTPSPAETASLDESTWVALAQAGDRQAFCQLVNHYQRPIYHLCYRMLPDSMTAEDAAQEVFLRAYLKLASYDNAYKFSTWLYAIATHYCLDWLKRRRLKLVSWEDVTPEQPFVVDSLPQPEVSLLKTEEVEAVGHLIQTLKPDQRALVILKYWSDLSYEEIGSIFGMTTSAVKSKLFRARRTLARTAVRRCSPVVPRSMPVPVPG